MPPDDRMLHAASKGLQRDPPLARSWLPLALAAGRAARQADLWHLEESSPMHGRAMHGVVAGQVGPEGALSVFKVYFR